MASAVSPFGELLRQWRRARGLSQLALAAEARTTPRHVSFIETGRSRPGRELVLRIAECLAIPLRERNRLLSAAGFAPSYAETSLDQGELASFRDHITALLDRHDPYPGSAVDARGVIHLANRAFRRFFPDSESSTAEEIVDRFFGKMGPERIENWPEVGWALVDQRRAQAREASHPDLVELAERAASHLKRVPRPELAASPPPIVCARTRIGEQTITTYSAVLRFDRALDVTLSELRLELIFPADERTAEFFRRAASADEG